MDTQVSQEQIDHDQLQSQGSQTRQHLEMNLRTFKSAAHLVLNKCLLPSPQNAKQLQHKEFNPTNLTRFRPSFFKMPGLTSNHSMLNKTCT